MAIRRCSLQIGALAFVFETNETDFHCKGRETELPVSSGLSGNKLTNKMLWHLW